jgi:hypothetical protein
MQYAIMPETLQVISEKLSEMALRDLGLNMKFEWPEKAEIRGRLTTVNIITDHKLTPAERQKLEDWSKDKLGASWEPRTIWERLEDEVDP